MEHLKTSHIILRKNVPALNNDGHLDPDSRFSPKILSKSVRHGTVGGAFLQLLEN